MPAIDSITAMRPWLRITGGLVGFVALYICYTAIAAIAGRAVLPPSAGAFLLVIGALAAVPAQLLWRQAETATRYINEPTPSRLHELTSAMRRFWRLAAVVAVLQLTVFAAGFALHGGL